MILRFNRLSLLQYVKLNKIWNAIVIKKWMKPYNNKKVLYIVN